MDKRLFRQKYLGELTLKNGVHVKFLYPIDKQEVYIHVLSAKHLFEQIHKYNNPDNKYWWVLFDDLSLAQFQIVYAATKKYGDDYWKRVWNIRNKK